MALLVTPSSWGQVYVADSPGAADRVASAEDRLSKDEPAEAARLLQRVLDDDRARLLETEEGRYAEAREVAARLLLSDERLLSTYREMHGSTAERQLESAGNDRERLRQVRQRFPVTEAALEAALREAGLALAEGRPSAGRVALEAVSEHPDLDAHRTRYEQLMGSAALLSEDEPRFDRYLDSLQRREAADAQDAVALLDRLRESLRVPEPEQAFTPMQQLPETPLPRVLDEPLWSYDIRGAETYLVEAYQADEHRLDGLGEDGRFLNAMFSVADGVVYLNDGMILAALDASSGMEIWRRQMTELESSAQPFGRPYSQWLPYGVDINGIAVGGDRVAAVTGFSAMVTIYGSQRRDGQSEMVLLNAGDGETLWQRTPDDVSDDFEDAFWYGQPIIDHDRLYATIRRRQRTQFQDAYVVCLDLETGDPLWRRHIASTALTDRQSVPAMAHMLLRDGRLYVDSRLGTVARIAAADGTIEWLTMLPIDEEDRAEIVQKPWHAPTPVLVEGGLVVLDDWGEQLYLLDPDTGERKDAISSSDWSKPLYLTRVGSDVLAVGESLVRIDGKTFDPHWRYEVRGDHRGRAAVAENQLLLPADEDVQVINLEDGELADRIELPLPATLLTLDGQVLVAGREQMRSYSSWDLASERMQERIDESPEDPRPLMAMAWLAFNTERHDALLKTLDQAIDLTQEMEGETAGTLFEQVMTMTESEGGDAELRSALFDRAAALADGVPQEINYRLALGEFHESRADYADAMEQYQTLLAEPAYRQELHEHEGGARQAGLEAQRRMQALIAAHGRELYQPYEAYAARRLEQLAEQGDPAPLVELAEAYPMAEVTPEALRLAARRAADQGRLRHGLALLRQAAQLTKDADHIARIYGLQAELFEEAGQPHRARRVLRTLSAIHPEVDPIRDDEAIEVDTWIDELASQPQFRGVAEINLPFTGKPRSIAGRIARPRAQDPHVAPSGNWLFRNQDRFELRSGDGFDMLWHAPLENEDTQLLSMDRNRLWFWTPNTHTVRVLSADDGEVTWEDGGVWQRLQQVEPDIPAPPADGVVPRGQQAALQRLRMGEQGADEVMVGVSDTAFAAADGLGRVVVLDSEDGHVQWQQATRVRSASHLAMDDRHLIIAGTDAEDVPIICIYDIADGELVHRLNNPARQPIRWMGVSEAGLLLYLSAGQVEAFDLGRGQSRWLCRPGEDLVGEGGAWLGPNRLVARTRDGDLVWIDLADGQLTGKLAVRGQLQGQIEARHDAERWFVTSTNRVIATDNDGDQIWRDSIADVARHLDHVVTERYVVALGTLIEDRAAGGVHKRRLYVLDRETGAILHERQVEAEQMLVNLLAADGRLLLTGPRITAVLTGAP